VRLVVRLFDRRIVRLFVVADQVDHLGGGTHIGCNLLESPTLPLRAAGGALETE
jgi:hypothetical protein